MSSVDVFRSIFGILGDNSPVALKDANNAINEIQKVTGPELLNATLVDPSDKNNSGLSGSNSTPDKSGSDQGDGGSAVDPQFAIDQAAEIEAAERAAQIEDAQRRADENNITLEQQLFRDQLARVGQAFIDPQEKDPNDPAPRDDVFSPFYGLTPVGSGLGGNPIFGVLPGTTPATNRNNAEEDIDNADNAQVGGLLNTTPTPGMINTGFGGRLINY